jgi:DNA modification methylase
LVLDSFAGVGTCPVVCKQHQRNFIAFEINQDFVRASEERLLKINDSQLNDSQLNDSQQILEFNFGK